MLKPTGLYKKENGKIILKLRKKCGTNKAFEIKADDVAGLKVEILKVF